MFTGVGALQFPVYNMICNDLMQQRKGRGLLGKGEDNYCLASEMLFCRGGGGEFTFTIPRYFIFFCFLIKKKPLGFTSAYARHALTM
jgi:hypothetical protein